MTYHGGAPRVRKEKNARQTGASADSEELVIYKAELLDLVFTAAVTAAVTAGVNKAMQK